jgi:phospholipid transport system substrate-binding protein
MQKIKYAVFLLLLAFGVTAFAQPSPIPMLQSTSDQMIAALQQNKASLNKPGVVYGLTRRILLPHVDTAGMARSVLGKDVWAGATSAQRQRFTDQFIMLLIRTYSAAFAAYTNEKVQFMPLRGDISGQTFTEAESQIIRQGGPAVSVSYRLVLQKGQWKLYDFSVDGVSMIESFRSQFADQLSQGNLDGLIQQLTQHNARPQKFGSQ